MHKLKLKTQQNDRKKTTTKDVKKHRRVNIMSVDKVVQIRASGVHLNRAVINFKEQD